MSARTGACVARFRDKRRDYTLSRRARYMSRGGSFPCSFALELQRERAHSARPLSRSLRKSDAFSFARAPPLPFSRAPLYHLRGTRLSSATAKLKERNVLRRSDIMSIYLKLKHSTPRAEPHGRGKCAKGLKKHKSTIKV